MRKQYMRGKYSMYVVDPDGSPVLIFNTTAGPAGCIGRTFHCTMTPDECRTLAKTLNRIAGLGPVKILDDNEKLVASEEVANDLERSRQAEDAKGDEYDNA